MNKSTILLIILAVALLGSWYLLSVIEKESLSVPERRQFFDVDSTTVDSIAFKYATWTLLSKTGEDWHVYFPGWSHKASRGMVAQMFRASNEMILENVIATKAAKHDKFQIDTARGAILQFFEQGVPVSELVLGKRAPGATQTYVRAIDSDTVYQARGDLQNIFHRAPSEWVDLTVFTCDSTAVNRVQWNEGGVKTVVERGEDRVWWLTKTGSERRVPLDTALLSLKLMKLCPLRADAVQMDPSPVEPALDNPWGSVVISTFDGRSDTLLWNPIDETQGGRTYAFRAGHARPLYIFFKPSYDRLFSRYDDLFIEDGA